MRPKFVVAVLLIAGFSIGVALFLKRQTPVKPTPATAVPVVEATPAPAAVPAPVVPARKIMTPEERAAVIDTEKERSLDLSMKDDPQSYSNILGDLISPEKEVRMAAIEAIKNFGNTNAIPILKGMVPNTTDNDEAIALLQAADFLS